MERPRRTVLVTGSSGLIGSEAVAHYDRKGDQVLGIDNNMRADFFGPNGDTSWNLERLQKSTRRFAHHALDIRDREAVLAFFAKHRPDVVIHCAAQPSHDLAAQRPFDDFDVNAVGTLNLLEAARRSAPESPFLFMSTNKVYGDAPNEVPLVETETRFEYARPRDWHGIDESCRIDQTMHSIFGASKVAADVMVQEYGRYFGMPTASFRGGCLTGPNHSGAKLHGFLSYLVKVAVKNEEYTIIGHKGKQVRDQIHSADVVAAFDAYVRAPRPGEAYNLGGGRFSNGSVREALDWLRDRLGRSVKTRYDENARKGDHVCYVSDLRKFQGHYPDWSPTRTLPQIMEEIVQAALASEGSARV